MRTDLASIKAKLDYLNAERDVRFAANVLRIWEFGDTFREALGDTSLEPQERLATALSNRQLGQLWFYKREDWGFWELDESETAWEGEHDWHVIGESALADTSAILLNAHTGETVFYDGDAWGWDIEDNFIVVKDSLASFVDDVALGPEYERLYYQSLAALGSILKVGGDDFPGVQADPWYHLVHEMEADLFAGPAVDRGKRRELNRRIEAYFADAGD
jgi:hypothetical protein